jgi:transcription elongation factor GreB
LESDPGDEVERRRRREIVTGRLSDLVARIASAEVVDPGRQPHDRVRFGARVTVRSEDGERAGEERCLEIVGVDEADASNGRVAFIAPIARAILGLAVGETTSLRTPRGEELLQVMSIEYPAD